MKFKRIFTSASSNAFDGIKFEKRTSLLRNVDGKLGMTAVELTVPEFWSHMASDILAQKYLRRAEIAVHLKTVPEEGMPEWLWPSVPDMDRLTELPEAERFGAETDARQVFHRMAGCWAYWGVKSGTFDVDTAKIFYDEMAYILANQIAAPNSPQWFNTGLNWAYGISRDQRGHFRVDPVTKDCVEVPNPYAYPQAHACFIQSVQDDLCGDDGLMSLWTKEARLFKFGSGTGTNFSAIRGIDEPLSGGGKSSGLMSFLHIGDAAAGAIKSGGTTRRAAKMVCLDIDHPDIENFIHWKRTEEEKVAALVVGSKITHDCVEQMKADVIKHRDRLGAKAADPLKNSDLADTVRDGLLAKVPEALIYRTLLALNDNVDQPELVLFDASWEGNAYQSVSGQNANNSVRLSAEFMNAVSKDLTWDLRRRTDGGVSKTVRAKDLWNDIAYNAWACADPGLQFDTTLNCWHCCPKSGAIRASNPCSEFMFLDDTACNLASINLVKFLREDGSFDHVSYAGVVELYTVALEITVTMAQYPSKKIASQSYRFRPLGLGYANLGSLAMRKALAYDSNEARALAAAIASLTTAVSYKTSSVLAKKLGAFEGYAENANDMLKVIRNHRRAAYFAPKDSYEDLSVPPSLPPEAAFERDLVLAAQNAWDEVIELGAKHGFRNAQATCIAPTGTIGLVMDCDTTGVEPDFALVKFKKLIGGGYFRIINTAIPNALKHLGYNADQIESISRYILGHTTLEGAPFIHPDALRLRGFDEVTLAAVEQALIGAFDLHFAVSPSVVGEVFARDVLRVPEESLSDPGFDLLTFLGFTQAQIAAANDYAFGTMTIEGAPELKDKDLSVFDCANRCGEQGTRFIPAIAHVSMMAAIQPFISGAISKTINFPAEATIAEIARMHMMAYQMGLKAIAIYRDGSKLSQPLSSTKLFNLADLLAKQEQPKAKVKAVEKEDCTEVPLANRHKLPSRRSGYTQKAAINHNNIYLRTGEYQDGSIGEIFIDMHKEGAAFRSLMNCFAIAVSLGLQHGVPLEEYVDAFVFTRFDPSGPVAGHSTIKFATSIIDYIFRELAITYLGKKDLAHVNPDELHQEEDENAAFSVPYLPGFEGRRAQSHPSGRPVSEENLQAVVKTQENRPKVRDARQIARLKGYEGDPCGECGNFTMLRNGTCLKCESCGSTSGCS